jgi:hypothetical protein
MICPVAPALPNSAIMPPKRQKTGYRQPNRDAGKRGDGPWRPLIHAQCSRRAASLLSGGGQQPVWQPSVACFPRPASRLKKARAGSRWRSRTSRRRRGQARRGADTPQGACAARAGPPALRQAGAGAGAGRRASFSNREAGRGKQARTRATDLRSDERKRANHPAKPPHRHRYGGLKSCTSGNTALTPSPPR